MVGAAKDLARPAALGRRASAMPADVIESPQLVFAIAAYQQRLAGNLGSEIVARLGGLLVSARYLPGAREHPLALRLVHRSIRVQCGRQSPGASDVGINREIRQTLTAHEAALYTPHFRCGNSASLRDLQCQPMLRPLFDPYPPFYYVGWPTLALINAGLAQGKNRSGLIWFLISLLFGPLATLVLVILPRK